MSQALNLAARPFVNRRPGPAWTALRSGQDADEASHQVAQLALSEGRRKAFTVSEATAFARRCRGRRTGGQASARSRDRSLTTLPPPRRE